MKLQSINQQQNFQGIADKTAGFIARHPVAIAGLAGSSVIAQKIVMSSAEATVAPAMDILIGKGITKATKEKDGRTNQSSKTQAIRTNAQAVGGTITGVIIRGLAIAAMTGVMMKAGEKTGSKLGEVINPNKLSSKENLYKYQENAAAWGKSIGGAVALLVMTVTNFLIDVPLINAINKKLTDILSKDKKSQEVNNA